MSIENICMLSTHGYFDPVPQLGRTDTGGQVVYVLQLARALSKQGVKIDIYTRWFDRTKAQIEPLPGCPMARVIRIPAGDWAFIPKEDIYKVLPELVANMATFIRENKLHYDLYHGHYVDAGIVTLDIAREFEKPAFFTAHSIGAWKKEQMEGEPEEMEKKYNFTHRISEEQRIFKTVTAQTVTTQTQRDKIDQLYGFKSDNIVVIPPGVDVHTFCPQKTDEKQIKTNLPDKYILCLSRIDTNKGHDLLLNAFKHVKDEVPDIQLVIAGGSAKPQTRELEVIATMNNIITRKKMTDRVHIVGYVPDELLVPYYQQAKLFVLPSVFEPFGMTALEAMACSTPVVASKFGGIRNVITSGENGLLVDAHNQGEFAEAMIRLLKDQSLAEKMGKDGYRTIIDSYSWEAIAERHLNFYNKYIKICSVQA